MSKSMSPKCVLSPLDLNTLESVRATIGETGALNYLIELKKNTGTYSQEEHKQDLCKLAKTAEHEGHYYLAREPLQELGRHKDVYRIAKKCFKAGWYNAAFEGFKFAGDKKGMLNVIQKMLVSGDSEPSDSHIRSMVADYLGRELLASIECNYKSWAQKKGYGVSPIHMIRALNLAYNLADWYDHGIIIAKGGLMSGYFFECFGLECSIADVHDKGASFSWNTLKELSKKKVVVIENDVVSGGTLERVITEIEPYNPLRIDLALCSNPVSADATGSNFGNIPKQFGNVYYPNKFRYEHLNKIVEHLEQILRP